MGNKKRLLWSGLTVLSIGLWIGPSGGAWAQGGPPMVTDDPDTPGDGHWEINIAAIGSHTPGRFDLAAPDADINYGWGDHVQLRLDVAWQGAVFAGDHWTTGVGAPGLGVKWRFLDAERSGVSMSTYPQFVQSVLGSSVRRGLADPGKQFFLPIEIAGEVAGFGLDGEVGHNFVQVAPDQWAAGVIAAHGCGAGSECRLEVHATYEPHATQTLLNLGFTHHLSPSLNLLTALGRDFGPANTGRRSLLFYLGLQIER